MVQPDALLLARVQFAFTVGFHIVFPALTIGLASFLVVLEGAWLRTGREPFRELYVFWSKVFAVNFGMGVVSGIVMAYEFGANWSRFSDAAGSVTGPLLTYEVLTAFFLEAGFLGVMLYGWRRVGPALHFLSTLMVALGTLVSATWIVASNSWMQTPQGYALVDGRFVPVDWLAVIFNPSFPYRLVHMTLAAFLATALVVGAAGAWHLLRGRDDAAIRHMTSMAIGMLVIVGPLQALVGDAHGLNTLRHQPAKIAAIEGHWRNEPGRGVPLILVGWPDMATESTRSLLEVPELASILLTHSRAGSFPGLREFPASDRPNATVVFWSFRVMVGLGVLIIGVGAWAAWARLRGTWLRSRWLLRALLAIGPAGLVAIIAGWITTEVGRQPWVVYGVMRTADAVAPHGAGVLSFSLLLFVVVYLLVFGAGVGYLLRLIVRGPGTGGDNLVPAAAGGPRRLLGAGNEGTVGSGP
ncbi:MAG: cytochrome ubiquinol oxidase subunit I [Proteobacteria bacterium]|nr:cytochrome ubiquinol oxidase subunit I [Pseudomonadota bacterium]